MKVGIVIVVFNISHLIEKQIQLFDRFCKDKFDLIIADNSTDLVNAAKVKSIVTRLGKTYIKTNADVPDFSQSHATACNSIYNRLNNQYNYLFFIDHDNFPIKDFSIEKIMENKLIAGVGQARGDIEYFWPGSVILSNQINPSMVDFSVNNRYGLDTGGNLFKIIRHYGRDKCLFFDQLDIPSPEFKETYGIYNLIYNSTFMHFINGSNWNNKSDNETRINFLLNKLEDYIK